VLLILDAWADRFSGLNVASACNRCQWSEFKLGGHLTTAGWPMGLLHQATVANVHLRVPFGIVLLYLLSVRVWLAMSGFSSYIGVMHCNQLKHASLI